VSSCWGGCRETAAHTGINDGGEGGIRTHGDFRLGGFQDHCLQPLGHPSAEVEKEEREGFEPSVEIAPHNGLAIRHLQPLGHLSGEKAPNTGLEPVTLGLEDRCSIQMS
jgi:hypothetical protein